MERNFIEEGRASPQKQLNPAADALEDLLQAPVTRRQALGALSSAITLSLVACRGTEPAPSSPRRPTPAQPGLPAPTEQLKPQISENEKTIQQEAIRLGLSPDHQERILWENFRYQYDPNYQQKFPGEIERKQEAEKRIDSVLTLMYNSKNKYLKQAATDFNAFQQQLKATYIVQPDRQLFERQNSLMEVGADIANNKVMAYVVLSSNDVLETRSDVQLAILLSHEIEHLRNVIAYHDSLDASYTPQEKLEKIRETRRDRAKFIAEEARGYGEQALAYINHYGLGFILRGSTEERIAAAFIRAGGKKDSKEWLAFTEYYLTQINAPKP